MTELTIVTDPYSITRAAKRTIEIDEKAYAFEFKETIETSQGRVHKWIIHPMHPYWGLYLYVLDTEENKAAEVKLFEEIEKAHPQTPTEILAYELAKYFYLGFYLDKDATIDRSKVAIEKAQENWQNYLVKAEGILASLDLTKNGRSNLPPK